MTEQNQHAASAKTRTRSPSYPAFGLEEAIRKADVVYEDVERRPVPVDVLASHWESSTTSSGFLTAIAALKQFGLSVDECKGPGRRLHLSDLALDIHIHELDSPERIKALKMAALSPKIHQELWEKYQGNLPTSDAAIRVYLLKGRKEEGKGEPFNKDAVDPFVRQFRSTIAFAGLDSSDKIPSADEEGGDQREEKQFDSSKAVRYPSRQRGGQPAQPPPPQPQRRQNMQAEQGFQQATFPMNGGDAIVQWPEGISAEEFKDFEDWLQLVIRKAKRSVVVEQTEYHSEQD